jgi:hypothetical protein
MALAKNVSALEPEEQRALDRDLLARYDEKRREKYTGTRLSPLQLKSLSVTSVAMDLYPESPKTRAQVHARLTYLILCRERDPGILEPDPVPPFRNHEWGKK